MDLFIKKFDIKRNGYMAIEIFISGHIDGISTDKILHLFIEHAISPSGPWKRIAWKPMYSPGEFSFEYIDYDVQGYNLNSEDYYRLNVRYEELDHEITDASDITRPDSNKFNEMKPVIIHLPKDDYNFEFDNDDMLYTRDIHKRTFEAITIAKKHNPDWLLGEPKIQIKYVYRVGQKMERFLHKNGVYVWLFKRDTTGAHCPVCWDDVKGIRKTSNCRLCLGTGWAHPYANPIMVRTRIYSPAETYQITPIGKIVINQYRAFLSSYPEVNPEDIMVAPSLEDVYEIESVEKNQLNGYTTYQICELKLIPRSENKYRLIDLARKLWDENGKK